MDLNRILELSNSNHLYNHRNQLKFEHSKMPRSLLRIILTIAVVVTISLQKGEIVNCYRLIYKFDSIREIISFEEKN